jgi:mono/diheme cytochrome c family protein
MKSVLIVIALFVGIALYSCGGGSSSDNSNGSEAVSNAGKSPAMMENSKSAVDVDAPSKSKGVGKFTDVKVPSGIDAKMAAKGQEVFNTKCTACHQATDQKLIGPGLKGITKIRTPEWIMNMITNPDQMTQQDPVAEALLVQFNHTQMTNQGLTDEEAREVLEFFRQNDAK